MFTDAPTTNDSLLAAFRQGPLNHLCHPEYRRTPPSAQSLQRETPIKRQSQSPRKQTDNATEPEEEATEPEEEPAQGNSRGALSALWGLQQRDGGGPGQAW